jgi:hypothetical protein
MDSDQAARARPRLISQIMPLALLAILALGLFFAWRLTQFSPADIRRAVHLQDEGESWRKLGARLSAPHDRADEIAAYQDYLRQFPPAVPPTKREAQALAKLHALGAEPPPR